MHDSRPQRGPEDPERPRPRRRGPRPLGVHLPGDDDEVVAPPTRAVVFRGPDGRACREPTLVLAAVGIPCEHVRLDGETLITVAEEHAARARRELRAYVDENRRRVEPPPFNPLSDGVAIGAAWCLALLGLRALALAEAGGHDWHAAGGMWAGPLLAGEWWRAFTALFLHADALHLGSNVVFGTIFAVFLAQHLGSGGAAFTLVAAGGLGNLLNALTIGAEHRSIGASTAVFAAVGAFVTDEFLRRRRHSGEAFRRWAPIVLGVLLLGWFGGGGGDESVDVSAHVFGFAAGGGVTGWLALVDRRWSLRDPRLQGLLWTVAVGVVAAAWWCALR